MNRLADAPRATRVRATRSEHCENRSAGFDVATVELWSTPPLAAAPVAGDSEAARWQHLQVQKAIARLARPCTKTRALTPWHGTPVISYEYDCMS